MIGERTDFHPPYRYGRATPGEQGQSGTDPGDFQEATLRDLPHGRSRFCITGSRSGNLTYAVTA
jgi:hypothetical protein